MGALTYHGKSIIEKYTNPNITTAEIKKEAENYIAGCKKGSVGDYWQSAYGTSKMMLNAWSRFILQYT